MRHLPPRVRVFLFDIRKPVLAVVALAVFAAPFAVSALPLHWLYQPIRPASNTVPIPGPRPHHHHPCRHRP